MATADVRLYLLGTLWEVEIDFEYDSEDNWETIDISEVWLLGYYPEKSVAQIETAPPNAAATRWNDGRQGIVS